MMAVFIQFKTVQEKNHEKRINGKTWTIGKAHIQLAQSSVVTKHTFMDYITGGMEMKFVVAIDYTASNLDPEDPDSLHYNNGSTPNHYVQVRGIYFTSYPFQAKSSLFHSKL